MKKLVRLTESDLHRIVKESVNRVLNEVQFGGESLHGNNPADWNALDRLHRNLADYYGSQDEFDPRFFDHLHKSERDEKNFADLVDSENAALGQDIYSPEFDERARNYYRQGRQKYANMGKNLGLKPRY